MAICYSCAQVNSDLGVICAQCGARLVLQGKYRITRLLGSGGFGAVYLAEQPALGNALCAIKELLPDPNVSQSQRQAATEQFRLEASILAQLSHPMLPRVSDFFVEDNRAYLVMEYIAGATLEERLRQTNAPFPEAQVKAWADKLCGVLTYLHTRQPHPVIHRDVKPSNIKLMSDGSLKLIDFGIAKLLAVGVRTQDAARAVSPPYSPMEQYGKGTDARTDIYALGVTLYQLLTNHLPPEAPDLSTHSITPPQQLNPAISSDMQTVVLKAMANDPARRYSSAVEMQHALTHPQEGTKKLPDGTRRLDEREKTPRRIPAPAIGAFIALVLLVIGGLAWQANDANVRAQATATAFAVATAQAQTTATAQANAALTATAQARATEQAHATATAAARATEQAQATAQARSAATAQANAQATTQAIAAEAARVQANATAQARAAATAQANAQATTQAAAAQAARAQAEATAQARAAATAQAATIRNCRLDDPSMGSARFDNWVGLDLAVVLLRDGRVVFQATLLNDARGCLPNLEPGTYNWRVRAPARLSLGEAVGSVVIRTGSDFVIPFCVADGKISNNCQ